MARALEAVAEELRAEREKPDAIAAASQETLPYTRRIADALGALRALVSDQTPTEQLESDLQVVKGVVAAIVGGSEKAAQVCAACHGTDGVSQNPIYPHIGGQYEDYMLHSLRAYKSGARQNAIMQGMVAPLSDQDLEDLAAYYAAQPGNLKDSPN